MILSSSSASLPNFTIDLTAASRCSATAGHRERSTKDARSQVATRVSVPKRSFLLLSGVPAVGKSSFGRYLAREHAFAHYDLECYPRGWPHPELKPVWDSSRASFVAQLKGLHDRVVLDWGFPVNAVPWVRELLAAGVRLVWFAADTGKARELFLQRGGIAVANFDAQVRGIEQASLPNSLQCVRVGALRNTGKLSDPSEILRAIFRE